MEQAGQYGRCLDRSEEIAQPPTSIYCASNGLTHRSRKSRSGQITIRCEGSFWLKPALSQQVLTTYRRTLCETPRPIPFPFGAKVTRVFKLSSFCFTKSTGLGKDDDGNVGRLRDSSKHGGTAQSDAHLLGAHSGKVPRHASRPGALESAQNSSGRPIFGVLAICVQNFCESFASGQFRVFLRVSFS